MCINQLGRCKHIAPCHASFVVVIYSLQDALREECDDSVECTHNCCVSKVVTPVYFVVFVLTAQFVLVNVVVAVLMKHLEVSLYSA